MLASQLQMEDIVCYVGHFKQRLFQTALWRNHSPISFVVAQAKKQNFSFGFHHVYIRRDSAIFVNRDIKLAQQEGSVGPFARV